MSQELAGNASPDDELLGRVAAGDAEAFAALFRRRKGMVYRFALHMSGSPATADDVTQEVFLTVMREAERYERGRTDALAWLCGIARNHVRRRLADGRVVPLDEEPCGSPAHVGTFVDPLEVLSRAERLDMLHRAVLSLPAAYREAVVLCDLEEMSYADAATVLGCAVGTVRSRLHRGRALLVSKLRAMETMRCAT